VKKKRVAHNHKQQENPFSISQAKAVSYIHKIEIADLGGQIDQVYFNKKKLKGKGLKGDLNLSVTGHGVYGNASVLGCIFNGIFQQVCHRPMSFPQCRESWQGGF